MIRAKNSGVRFVSSRFAHPLARPATVAAVALALFLAGCGLKGSLDPPPAATPAQAQLEAAPGTPPPPPPEGESQPQALRKRIFLDWLLD
jgi:predicted small lipoprotein YifL